MPDFDFLRTASRFNNRPFGMPDIDSGSISELFRQIVPMVNSMKNDDLYRQKELMQFQQSLANARNMPADPNLITRGPNAVKKQQIVQYAPPTAMQQKFAKDEALAREERFKMGQLEAAQKGNLAAALATGKQRSEADMARIAAEINARATEGAAERASREKVAETNLKAQAAEHKTQREFTSEENKLNREQKGQPFNIPDPNDPTKTIAVRWNPATQRAEPIMIDGQNVTNLMKPGTKPGSAGTNPKLQDLRGKTQEALDEIANVLNEDGSLTGKGKAAVGWSSLWSGLPATAGRAGRNSINRIKSQQVLNLIADMKAQSKTGATGFGNMSNKDLSVLENAATKLDTLTDEGEFAKELGRIRGLLRKVMEDQASPAEPDRPGTVSHGKKPRLDPDELLKKYGG